MNKATPFLYTTELLKSQITKHPIDHEDILALSSESIDDQIIAVSESTPLEFIRQRAVQLIPRLLNNLNTFIEGPYAGPRIVNWLVLSGADAHHEGVHATLELLGASVGSEPRIATGEHRTYTDISYPYLEVPGPYLTTTTIESTGEDALVLQPITTVGLHISKPKESLRQSTTIAMKH